MENKRRLCDSHQFMSSTLKEVKEAMSSFSAEVAVLKSKLTGSVWVTNILILVGMAIIGYTHVESSRAEKELRAETSSIKVDVARVEENITALEQRADEILHILRDPNGAFARGRENQSTLLAKDF